MASTNDTRGPLRRISLYVSPEDEFDMSEAAIAVGLSLQEWLLSLTEGPLRYFRENRDREKKPKRRRPREND